MCCYGNLIVYATGFEIFVCDLTTVITLHVTLYLFITKQLRCIKACPLYQRFQAAFIT